MTTITAVDATGQGPIAPANKQTDTVSNPETVTQEATQEVKAADPRLALLARQQKAIRAQQRALAQEKQAWESQKQATSTELEQAKSWKTRLAQDPYGVMLETGLTSDQVAALLLNQPNPQDQNITQLKSEYQKLQEEIQLLKSGQQDSATQSRVAAEKQILHDVSAIVAGDDKYEAIKTYGEPAKQAVVELIAKTFDQDGYVMDTSEAIEAVEDYLIEEAMKAAQLKKVLAKINPPAPAQPEPSKQQSQTQKQQFQTLSNRMVQSATKPLSERERRERAIAAFQGKV